MIHHAGWRPPPPNYRKPPSWLHWVFWVPLIGRPLRWFYRDYFDSLSDISDVLLASLYARPPEEVI